ncbi:STAS domain-containing protein [Streptomyces collinus]|uniref:STAS domain-containing protein n=1 Tax=Streptomyces collinus TaxID=42684 RepID=UPI0029430C72|nr:STAS domain-containing protein [Streptomyces collinus]
METQNAYRPEPLRVTSTTTDTATIVAVSGEIDHNTAAPLIQALAPEQLGERPRAVVDMREVSFMDSSGINVLLAAHRDLTPTGSLRLAGVQNSVMRTLQLVGVDSIIPCYPSLTDALTT